MIGLRGVTIRSGPFQLTDLELTVPTGTYGVLMGGTGQGKTTLLEAICGLRRVTAGRVLLGEREVTKLGPGDRNIGYVPQDLALFPMMSVRSHLEFALRVRRFSSKVIRDRVDELANSLGIASLLPRRISHLSGGEAQRVALGRALSFRPEVLILDEPLNALDEATRDRLCELLRSLQTLYGLTTLHVTHSRAEARGVADKLYLLRSGRVEEATLEQLSHPDNATPSTPTEKHT